MHFPISISSFDDYHAGYRIKIKLVCRLTSSIDLDIHKHEFPAQGKHLLKISLSITPPPSHSYFSTCQFSLSRLRTSSGLFSAASCIVLTFIPQVSLLLLLSFYQNRHKNCIIKNCENSKFYKPDLLIRENSLIYVFSKI